MMSHTNLFPFPLFTQRGALDNKLATVLHQLEHLLGPWRWLLCGQTAEPYVNNLIEEALDVLGPWKVEKGGGQQEVMGRSAVKACLTGLVETRAEEGKDKAEQLSELIDMAIKGRKPSTKRQIDEALALLAAGLGEEEEGKNSTTNDAASVKKSGGKSAREKEQDNLIEGE